MHKNTIDFIKITYFLDDKRRTSKTQKYMLCKNKNRDLPDYAKKKVASPNNLRQLNCEYFIYRELKGTIFPSIITLDLFGLKRHRH